MDNNYKEEKIILKVNEITKNFPGVKALDNVSLELRCGEIHALVGENGAGKSTLIKILSGVISEYSGEIIINGVKVKINNPRKAYNLGIGVVAQEYNIVPTLSVGQNLFLAHEPLVSKIIVNRRKIREEGKKILKYLGINVGIETLVGNLGIAQHQIIAIARALIFNPRILFLDEPTASLTTTEIERLFIILKELKNNGVSIVYVSHRLEEIFKIADKVTVLRDGKLIKTIDINKINTDSVITMMVGRKISEMYPVNSATIGEKALTLKNISKKDVCQKINLIVHSGEIVGIYGLVGAGRTELVRLIFGLEASDEGDIYIYGKKISNISPINSINSGLGFLTEDRIREGLCMNLSVKRNITRASLNKISHGGFLNLKKEEELASQYVNYLNIKTKSINGSVAFLSGGNQQKVILAQWLCVDSQIMILDEPTKGIDVGAKVEIYKIINALTEKRVAVLLISSDLPEIMGISNKIYVMYGGKISKCFEERNEFSSEDIISYAIGESVDAN